MIKKYVVLLLLCAATAIGFSFTEPARDAAYSDCYLRRMTALQSTLDELAQTIAAQKELKPQQINELKHQVHAARMRMKAADFWLRYLEPLAQKQINGPLPVEWETEVFEKFEKPYRREGAGLLLAETDLAADAPERDTVLRLIRSAQAAAQIYSRDSIMQRMADPASFWFCNRLFLLNLSALYTTGFECPDPERVIPEVCEMLQGAREIYRCYNLSYPETSIPQSYLTVFDSCVQFALAQPKQRDSFDHYTFLREHINVLFAMNQTCIKQYGLVSKNNLDYALNKNARSLFSKDLYEGQSVKGIYYNVLDPRVLDELRELGKQLFADPLLSGNNRRACASCHKPEQFFADSTSATAATFGGSGRLPRNTPSLVNAPLQHLSMWDGRHTSLQEQTLAVLTNPDEMACAQNDLLPKVLSCATYKKAFEKLLPYTPAYDTVSLEHILSALTFYYGQFSATQALFDRSMGGKTAISADERAGFNLFMGKAQCATCHFVPQFSGVKPPFVGSEFEVVGTPADKQYSRLSPDQGRYVVNPAKETQHALRTPSLRNVAHTAPYMHNGVFSNLDEVIDFYDFGGGAGHGLAVENQTLSADSLHLSITEKKQLKAFLLTLTEDIPEEKLPKKLPRSSVAAYNNRTPGGTY